MAYISPRRRISSATTLTVASAGLPSWVPAAGKYGIVSPTAMSTQVSPFYPPSSTNPAFGGTQGQTAMLTSWNGGTYVPTVGTLGSMYFWGGGHYAYYGDDVVRYDLATQTYSRAWGPSPYAVTVANGGNVANDTGHVRGTVNGEWVTGLAAGYTIPVPYHTYNSTQWVPQGAIPGSSALGSIVFFMQEATGLVVPIPSIWSFDLSKASNDMTAWTRRFQMTFPSATGAYGLHGTSTYDSKRNVVWTGSADTVRNLWRNDMTTNTSTAVANANFANYTNSSVSEGCMVYMPTLDCLVSHSSGNDYPRFYGIDLSSSPTATSSISGLTRHALVISNPSVGPFYSPGTQQGGGNFNMNVVDGAIYFTYVNATNVYIWKLTPPVTNWQTGPWVWSSQSLTPNTGSDTTQFATQSVDGQTQGLYSKARYVAAIKSIVYQFRPNLKMVAIRDPSWT